jgi:negative regulator of flagellin synthesis FlgM
MVDGIAGGGRGRVDAARAAASQRVSVLPKPMASRPIGSPSLTNTVRDMASDGPPVDSTRVAAIRTAIAEGRYPVDPQKIAQKMIELDLGPLA